MTRRSRWLRFTAHAARGAALAFRGVARGRLLRDQTGALADACASRDALEAGLRELGVEPPAATCDVCEETSASLRVVDEYGRRWCSSCVDRFWVPEVHA